MRTRAAALGLTLMEVLVALAVLSLLGGVLWHSLTQMARVERLIAVSALGEPVDMLRMQWVRRLIEAAMPVGLEERDSFRGERSRLDGLSTDAPSWPASTAQAFSLRLGQDGASGRYTMELLLGGDGQYPPSTPVRLLEWQGTPGRFEYMADDGSWHERWPVQTLRPQDRLLPRMVALRTGAPGWAVTLIHTRHSGLQQPSRKVLEQ